MRGAHVKIFKSKVKTLLSIKNPNRKDGYGPHSNSSRNDN